MVATGVRAETGAQVPIKKQADKLGMPVVEQEPPSRAESASSTDRVRTTTSDVSARALQAISEEVHALTRDIIAAEQEADLYLRKRAHCSVAETAWRSVTREVPMEMTGKVQDMRDRLSAAQQGINDTALSEEAEAFRLTEVREELEVSSHQEKVAAQECSGLRAELQEATRAASVERTILDRRPPAPTPLQSLCKADAAGAVARAGDGAAGVADSVAAQKARSEALFQLASARSEAAAASAELRGCEEALSEARQRRESQLKAVSAGLAEFERSAELKASAGPARNCLKAVDAEYLLSCKRSEELLNKVTTWRGLGASSRARAQAAEGKLQRATQRQAAAEQRAAEERERLEAAKPRLAEALQAAERAQRALEVARFWRQAASATLALALSLATARAMAVAGLTAA